MRRLILVLILVLLPACAFSGVLEEFNGVAWKSKFPKKGFKLVSAFDGSKFYRRTKNDDLYGIPSSEIIYTTNKGVFNAAHASFEEPSYVSIRTFLVSKYGNPVHNIANRELFLVRSKGKTTRAMLQHGLVNFTYQED